MVLPNGNPNPGNDPSGDPAVTPSAVLPVTTPQPVVPNPGNPVDWETQYKGLQGTYQKLFDEDKKLKDDFALLNQQHEKTKQDLAKALSDLAEKDQTVQLRDTDLSAKQESLKKSEGQLSRFKMIAEKFPLLLDMEIKGLVTIEDDDPAKLEEKLKTLNDAIATKIDQKSVGNLQITPPVANPPGNNLPSTDLEQIVDKLNDLAGKKDAESQKQYQELYQTYLGLLDQKPKQS